MNLGHQRAIALGALYVSEYISCDAIIFMDSDGEDSPNDLRLLLNCFKLHPNSIIIAKRAKRSESSFFIFFYFVYLYIFKMMVGKKLPYGNFSLIPIKILNNLLYDSNLWNHFAATINRSKVDIKMIPTDRANRYFGRSRMSFINLVTHGLSAISIYTDIIAVRLIIISLSIVILSSIFAVAIVILKLFTHYNIPGWTSQIIAILFLISITSCGFAFTLSLMILNARKQINFNLKKDGHQFLSNIIKYSSK